jgi:hypothetical protein
MYAELIEKLSNPETLVFKCTPAEQEQKSPSIILEWIMDFPEYIRSYSPISGRFLAGRNLYKII